MDGESSAAPSRESVSDAVYRHLRALIVSGDLTPGHRLTEAQITEKTGASRTPVREALRRLGAEGWVELTPRRGARVAPLGLGDTTEVFALRQLLETYGAGMAAVRATSERVARLRELTDAMNALVAQRPEAWSVGLTDLNREFHTAILDASGFPRLRAMSESLVLTGLVTVTFSTYTPTELARSMHHHDELVAAIAAADPDWARATMRAHLRAAEHVAHRILDHHSEPEGSGERKDT